MSKTYWTGFFFLLMNTEIKVTTTKKKEIQIAHHHHQNQAEKTKIIDIESFELPDFKKNDLCC